MPDSITIKLQGFKELADQLRAIGPQVARNGLRSADFSGAKIIRDAAKATAPVKTGLLQAQLYASRRRTPENVATYSVVVKKPKLALIALKRNAKRNRKFGEKAGPQIYARFLEFGTSKMAARPFLRPATENNVGNALDAIKAGLRKALDRAVKK